MMTKSLKVIPKIKLDKGKKKYLFISINVTITV